MNIVIRSVWARVVKGVSKLLADRKTAENPVDCEEKNVASLRPNGSSSPSVAEDGSMGKIISAVVRIFGVAEDDVIAVRGSDFNRNKALMAAVWIASWKLHLSTGEIAAGLRLREKHVQSIYRIARSELIVCKSKAFAEKVEACERELGLSSVSSQIKRNVTVCVSKSFWGKLKSCDEWFKGRRVVIDGTNVCYWGGKSGMGMSLALLLALCADLHRRGVDYMVYFDASTRYGLQKMGATGDAALYCRLLDARPDRFHEVKARTTADEAILMDVAAGMGNEKPTVFVTRDHYRDHVELFPFASDENLRLEGVVREDGIRFGKIGWFVPYMKVA